MDESSDREDGSIHQDASDDAIDSAGGNGRRRSTSAAEAVSGSERGHRAADMMVNEPGWSDGNGKRRNGDVGRS